MPFATSGEISLYYTTEGDPSNPPLVLLHWFMGSHQTWYDVSWVKTLEPFFYLILPDLRGYGQSSKPHDPRLYHPSQQVQDLCALLDTLGIEKAHFMGYSMGGRVCIAMASYAPERILSLVIGGMHPFAEVPTDLDERITLLKKGMKALLDAYEIGPLSIYRRLLQNDPEALLADTLQTKNWADLSQGLIHARFPILFYVGSDDGFYEGVKRIASQIKTTAFVSFPHETHRTAFVKKTLLIPHLRRFWNVPLK